LPNVQERQFLYITLKACIYEIIEHRWIVTVDNEVGKSALLQYREEIIAFFREKCMNQSIVMEVLVKEGHFKEDFKNLALTGENKKKLLEEKNPLLRLLQQKFNTFMN